MATRTGGGVGRRAVIAAGAGALTAAAAQAMAAPTRVLAGNGDPVLVGQLNTGTKVTTVNGGPGAGLRGVSAGADGVVGESSVINKSGVYGSSTHASGYGVVGHNDVTGTEGQLGCQAGVVAQGTADAPGLIVMGRVVFGNAGFQIVGAGKSSVTFNLNPSDLTANSIVFATLLQHRSGVYVAAAIPNVAAAKVTIYLNKKVSSATKVGFLVADW